MFNHHYLCNTIPHQFSVISVNFFTNCSMWRIVLAATRAHCFTKQVAKWRRKLLARILFCSLWLAGFQCPDIYIFSWRIYDLIIPSRQLHHHNKSCMSFCGWYANYDTLVKNNGMGNEGTTNQVHRRPQAYNQWTVDLIPLWRTLNSERDVIANWRCSVGIDTALFLSM